MKVVAVAALACGFIAAPMAVAGHSSASPSCDNADCVPNVTRNAALGEPCIFNTRYIFGLDSSGGTLVCSSSEKWLQSEGPLVGVYNLGAPCFGSQGLAQSPDGLAMACRYESWVATYDDVFYRSPF